MKYNWVIGGEAGFGIMTTGLTFSKIASRSGYQVLDYVEYPSLIRGGHNAYKVTFSDSPVHTLKETIDVLVCLNKATFELHKHELSKDSVIVHDKEDFEIDGEYKTAHVPFKKILREGQGQSIMKNTIALGASLATVGGDLALLESIIETQFQKKGEKVIAFNKSFAKQGFDSITKNFKEHCLDALVPKQNPLDQLVMTGNDAFSLGAIIADCKFYCAYPMTPSSSVLTSLAAWQQKAQITVRHAEDEIAVINSAIGASHGGVRSAVGTSGGGFALMVEAVSLAGITETPIVIFISQRPGPATGMPTWTEQGDLLFSVHSGHGEFPKIILTPGDVDEMIRLTAEAFDLADIYQTPVIVMSDMYLSEAHASISSSQVLSFFSSMKINRGKTVSQPTDRPYLRYKITEDGISERLIPGAKDHFFQANSYEHSEDGHTSETAEDRMAQVGKRARKIQTYLKTHFKLPTVFGDLKTANTVLVCCGSLKGVCLDVLNSRSNTAVIHFTHTYPLDEMRVKNLLSEPNKCVLVEQNSTSQLGLLLREQTGINIEKHILRYDGRPMTASEIIKQL
jgi:2-oxoglutarate ferredoxin oxidoreductase subunit alpha